MIVSSIATTLTSAKINLVRVVVRSAIVLGLALQGTLSDVISGISLSIEKSYSLRDEFLLEDGTGLTEQASQSAAGRVKSVRTIWG